MPFDYLPSRDSELLIWMENFISVANANLADTGLTALQMTELNDLSTDFTTAYGAQQASIAGARSASISKFEARDLLLALARELAQIVQAHPGATDQLKNELGLTVPAPPAPVIPTVPGDLVAAVGPQGQIGLRWSRNGNKQGTTFVIEVRLGDDRPWTFVAAVTRASYTDLGRTPGVYIQYRVHAVRTNKQSLYSEPASVYAPEGQSLAA